MGVPLGEAIELTQSEYLHEVRSKRIELIRQDRDRRIAEVEWRFRRYQDEELLGLQHSDDLVELAAYVQALRNVPQQPGFPDEIDWPQLENKKELGA